LRPTGRQISAVLAALAVVSLVLLPPEHVHTTRIHDGHHSDLVHRHFEGHRSDAAKQSFDDDDDQVVQWLDSRFTSPRPASHTHPPVTPFLTTVPPLLLPQPTSRRILTAIDVSVHDPPGIPSSGLRAPPHHVI
jgi:hypothetical protein